MNKERFAQVVQMKKALAKKEMSLSIRIQESDLYDWCPGQRYLLDTIARLQVNDLEAYYPEDSPYNGEQIGWCWMAQWRLALRVGLTEGQIQKDLQKFEDDGVIEVREWEDSNRARHAEYRVIESVVDDRQRPEQKRNVERPKRSKRDYKAYKNNGAFKKGKDRRRGRGFEPIDKAFEVANAQ